MYILVAPYNVEITGVRRYRYGNDIELSCTSDGGPQLEYNWIFSNGTVGNDNTLSINNAATYNGGNYTCNVTNNAGSDSSMTTVYSKFIMCKVVTYKLFYIHMVGKYEKLVKIVFNGLSLCKKI